MKDKDIIRIVEVGIDGNTLYEMPDTTFLLIDWAIVVYGTRYRIYRNIGYIISQLPKKVKATIKITKNYKPKSDVGIMFVDESVKNSVDNN